jgi:hypothetical protein
MRQRIKRVAHHVQRHKALHDDARGFGYLDTLVALALTAMALCSALAVGLPLMHAANLNASAQLLIGRMRFAQMLGTTSSEDGIIWMDPYDTGYRLSQGITWLGAYQNAPDVQYFDGYLQLPHSTIAYDSLGDSQVAGVIRLTSDGAERDIHLYMGTGLQVSGWIQP